MVAWGVALMRLATMEGVPLLCTANQSCLVRCCQNQYHHLLAQNLGVFQKFWFCITFSQTPEHLKASN